MLCDGNQLSGSGSAADRDAHVRRPDVLPDAARVAGLVHLHVLHLAGLVDGGGARDLPLLAPVIGHDVAGAELVGKTLSGFWGPWMRVAAQGEHQDWSNVIPPTQSQTSSGNASSHALLIPHRRRSPEAQSGGGQGRRSVG
jgi:hypothetical protein